MNNTDHDLMISQDIRATLPTIEAITRQPWSQLGSSQPLLSDLCGPEPPVLREEICERITGLLWVRVMALVSARQQNQEQSQSPQQPQPGVVYRVQDVAGVSAASSGVVVPPQVQEQLSAYVEVIVDTYLDVHYHSMHHVYHVVISANKLLDLLLTPDDYSSSTEEPPPPKRTYGLRSNPLYGLALVWAALIHDAGHVGVSNAQLVEEEDDLALLHNDQSVLEQHAIKIGFVELARPDYEELKTFLFPDRKEYKFFRHVVIDLVLCTDIASPERTQILKSKWKEAFGDNVSSVHKKQNEQQQRDSILLKSVLVSVDEDDEDDDDDDDTSNQSSLSDPDENEKEHENKDNEEDPASTTLTNTEKFYLSTAANAPPPQLLLHQRSSTTNDISSAPSFRHSVCTVDSSSIEEDQPVPQTSFRFRQVSAPVIPTSMMPSRKIRLGVRLAMDLDGNSVPEMRSSMHLGSLNRSIMIGVGQQSNYSNDTTNTTTNTVLSSSTPFNDQPDEFVAAVVLETMLKGADISFLMQGWSQYKLWSTLLFFEFSYAHQRGRNPRDPAEDWFDLQIIFIDSYVLPLAYKLQKVCPMPTTTTDGKQAPSFVDNVKTIRSLWLQEGREFVVWLMAKWKKVQLENDKKQAVQLEDDEKQAAQLEDDEKQSAQLEDDEKQNKNKEKVVIRERLVMMNGHRNRSVRRRPGFMQCFQGMRWN